MTPPLKNPGYAHGKAINDPNVIHSAVLVLYRPNLVVNITNKNETFSWLAIKDGVNKIILFCSFRIILL